MSLNDLQVLASLLRHGSKFLQVDIMVELEGLEPTTF